MVLIAWKSETIVFSEHTTDIILEEGLIKIDSIFVQNNTDYNLEYSLDSYSGDEIIHSVLFNAINHDLISNFENSITAKTISFWFKPIDSIGVIMKQDILILFLPIKMKQMNLGK